MEPKLTHYKFSLQSCLRPGRQMELSGKNGENDGFSHKIAMAIRGM